MSTVPVDKSGKIIMASGDACPTIHHMVAHASRLRKINGWTNKIIINICTSGGIMLEKPFGLAVGAFINNGKGCYLLIQRSQKSNHFADCWETPGGKMEYGEPFDLALMREVKEETGLTISLDGVAGVSEFELPHIRVVMLYMKAHVVEGEISLSEEHKDYLWLPLKKFQEKMLTPALEKVLQNVVFEF